MVAVLPHDSFKQTSLGDYDDVACMKIDIFSRLRASEIGVIVEQIN